MANSLFCFPNFVDSPYTPAYSGGSWEAALPLTNLSDDRLHWVARSTDDALASTKFIVDLGAIRYLRAVALLAHNLTIAAKVRVRGSNNADLSSPVYDSDWVDAFPTIYPAGTLPFGHPSYFTGKLTQEEWEAGYLRDFPHPLPTPQNFRYLGIDIDDTANPDGYVEIGRLWAAFAYQPTINWNETGFEIGWNTSSSKTETPGGRFIHSRRAGRRFANGTIGMMEDHEAMVFAFEIQRKFGTTEQLYFIYDPADTYHLQRRSFLATADKLSPLRFPNAWRDVAFSLIEEL